MSTGCSYCGVNPYVGCKHRPAVERPITINAEPIVEKVDGRKFGSGQGRAFAVHRAKQRKEREANTVADSRRVAVRQRQWKGGGGGSNGIF